MVKKAVAAPYNAVLSRLAEAVLSVGFGRYRGVRPVVTLLELSW